MKKKILNFAFLLVLAISVTACFGGKLNEIAKYFNNSESAKSYKEYGYDIEATVNDDTLTVTSKINDTESKVEFKLNGDILSNENLFPSDLMYTLMVINAIGETYGYKDGEMSQNINAFIDEYLNYTLDNEGLELAIGAEKVSFKIDLSKKVPLIDMNKFSLKVEDFDMISQMIADKENGNQSGKTGNIAYDVFLGDSESTITIGQEEKLSDSAYNSILAALEVIYGEDTAKHFQELYPSFVDGTKTIEAFTIETNYKMENQDDGVFKDTKVVLVTIDNSKVK